MIAASVEFLKNIILKKKKSRLVSLIFSLVSTLVIFSTVTPSFAQGVTLNTFSFTGPPMGTSSGKGLPGFQYIDISTPSPVQNISRMPTGEFGLIHSLGKWKVASIDAAGKLNLVGSFGKTATGLAVVNQTAWTVATSSKPSLYKSPSVQVTNSISPKIEIKSINLTNGIRGITIAVNNITPGSQLPIETINNNLVVAGYLKNNNTNSTVVDSYNPTNGSLIKATTIAGNLTALYPCSQSALVVSTAPALHKSTSAHMIQINPNTGAILTNAHIPTGFTPEAVVNSQIWGIEAGTGQLLTIIASSGAVAHRIILSHKGYLSFAHSLTSNGNSIWVSTSNSAIAKSGSYLFQINAKSGRVKRAMNLGSHPLSSSGSIAPWQNGVMVSTNKSLVTAD